MNVRVGEMVRYYNFTYEKVVTGMVTKIDVPANWVKQGARGIQIDGGLIRAYPCQEALLCRGGFERC